MNPLLRCTALLISLLVPQALSAQFSWERLPTPVGSDNTTALVSDGSTLFQTTPVRLWHSPDAGANWQKVTWPPLSGIRTLLIDSTGTLVAGGSPIGNAGPTLAYSTDDGVSWTPVEEVRDELGEGSIVIDTDGSWLVFHGRTGLRRSYDRGITWQSHDLPFSIDLSSFSTLALFPDGDLALSYGDRNTGEGSQYVTSDRGENWGLLDSTPVTRYHVISEDVFFALRPQPGRPPLPVRVNRATGQRDTLFPETYASDAYAFIRGDDDTLYALAGRPQNPYYGTSSPYLYRSTDLGQSWDTGRAIPNSHLTHIDFVDGSLLAFSEGGPFRSSDGGDTWSISAEGLSRSHSHRRRIVPTGVDSYVTGDLYSLLEEVGPAGERSLYINPSDMFFTPMMTATGDGTVYLSGLYRDLWKKSPGSRTLTRVETPYRDPESTGDEFAARAAFSILSIQQHGRDLILLGVGSGGVDVYEVEQDRWSAYPPPTESVSAVRWMAATGMHLFSHGGNGVFRIARDELIGDAPDADAWSRVLDLDDRTESVSMNATATGYVLVARTDSVLISSDEGDSWTSLVLPSFEGSITSAFVTSTGRIYVSMRKEFTYGLFTKESVGEEWERIQLDPERDELVMYFAESAGRELYAVTGSAGLYRTAVTSDVIEEAESSTSLLLSLSRSGEPVRITASDLFPGRHFGSFSGAWSCFQGNLPASGVKMGG